MNNWWGIGLTLVLALGWLFSKYWVKKKEAPFWQYLNICLPLGIWLVGGGIVWVVRQKLYTKKYAETKNRNE